LKKENLVMAHVFKPPHGERIGFYEATIRIPVFEGDQQDGPLQPLGNWLVYAHPKPAGSEPGHLNRAVELLASKFVEAKS
jgi:hypothetical protein